jgi:molybdopterin molybdotransferase
MTTYSEALALILAHSTRLPSERCAPLAALGRVLSEPVHSAHDLPPFDNAAMDGYALACGEEGFAAGSEHPVAGRQVAGDESRCSDGQALEIMTGARLPDGLDSVIAVERTEVVQRDGDRIERIRLSDALQPGANVRRAGSDVRAGSQALAAGRSVDAAAVMLLAALGVAGVDVTRRPRVAVISTGKELVDDPTQPLQSGQIYGSNAPYLVAALQSAGAEVVLCRTVDDQPQRFGQALDAALDVGVDLVLSTGAVSMGFHDFVPATLRALGAEVLYHKVAIRPGKPQLFARLPDGPLLFGLPGNPMAVAVGLRFFVAPALRALAGLPPERPLLARLAAPCRVKPGMRHFLKARVEQDAQAQLIVSLPGGQESFRIRPLLDCNAWAVFPEAGDEHAAGQLVEIFPLQPGQPLALLP